MVDTPNRLNGWKDISAALKRSVRTVQRWEHDYGLPVHRQGPEGELIFAFRDELDAWMRAGKSRRELRARAANGPSLTDGGSRTRFGPHSLIYDGRAHPLRDGLTVIGRADDADVQLLVPSVSRHHARIVVVGDNAAIEDLGSHHGTWLGDAKVAGETRLHTGDEMRLGTALLVYRFVRASETTM